MCKNKQKTIELFYTGVVTKTNRRTMIPNILNGHDTSKEIEHSLIVQNIESLDGIYYSVFQL